ncbi:MAG: hypothetical protein LWX70_04595 [Sphingobacteriia bacterium]|nr:hypothetical protein [Sphingobacteriia bacterium]
MQTILRNILIFIAAIISGSLVNMALIQIGSVLIPAPAGADTTTTEGLKASMHLFTPINFLFPFLAHAIGTLTASMIYTKLGTSYRLLISIFLSSLFLIGGIVNVLMLPSPLWFSVLDIVLAYIPMGILGYYILKPTTINN